MRNRISVIIISFISVFAYSQNNFQLFRNNNIKKYTARENSFIKNAVYADLATDEFNKLLKDDPQSWNMSLPISGLRENVSLSMMKFNFINDELEVIGTNSGRIAYEKGKYYIAKGNDGDGIGAISVYDDQIMGIIGFENGDNFNIGEIKNTEGEYIIYRDRDLNKDFGFFCDTEEYEYSENDFRDLQKYSRDSQAKCIDIYLEADFALYVEHGESIKNTVDFLLGLFAETALIYRNEGINIKVSSIKVWQTPDNYDTTSSHKALGQFGNNNKESVTDLNLLIALGGDGLGGVAWLNALCNENNHFAYANIDYTYKNIPLYSWSVMVITHELGHNLGSNHTHACKWFNEKRQIDDCGNVYSYNQGNTPEGDSCFDSENPIIPADGGSIMSYCHLIGVAGINLAKGFEEQPGNLIRKKVSDADCIDTCDNYGDTIPKAKFRTQYPLICINGDVKFIDESDNFPNEWTWIFEKKEGNDTLYHKFPVIRYLNEGTFDVTLIVSNALGSDTLLKTDFITVLPGPTAGFTYEMLDKQNVQFTNSSENANKYFWRFGDANVSFEENPKHKFIKAGFFAVELRATKDTCNTHSYFIDTIEIKIPLKASIIYDKVSICPGDSIYFQASEIGYDSVKWYFEGAVNYDSKVEKLFVVYPEEGEFDVSFVAFSKYGNDTLNKIKLINVLGIPEILFDFEISGDTVSFFNNSKDASSYSWDFGDSTSSSQLNPVHIYEGDGKYNVILEGKNMCFSSELQKEVIIDKVSTFESDTDSIVIFPNPCRGVFYISDRNLNDNIKWLTISNLKGESVFYKNSFSDSKSGNFEIDLTSLPVGFYNIELLISDNIVNKKLVIIK